MSVRLDVTAAPAPLPSAAHVVRRPGGWANPHAAGVGLGLVLLATYVVMGRGLGASGAYASIVAWAVHALAPAHAQANAYFRDYLGRGFGHPLAAWLVFEVLGVALGGLVSGLLAGRVRRTVDRGPRAGVAGRLAFAFAGGVLMAVGARLGRGCTSGQALSGGATLNAGSWAFMLMVFAGGYLLAAPMRRQWR